MRAKVNARRRPTHYVCPHCGEKLVAYIALSSPPRCGCGRIMLNVNGKTPGSQVWQGLVGGCAETSKKSDNLTGKAQAVTF